MWNIWIELKISILNLFNNNLLVSSLLNLLFNINEKKILLLWTLLSGILKIFVRYNRGAVRYSQESKSLKWLEPTNYYYLFVLSGSLLYPSLL
jgi:heme/copper-type cytochrome/quinol oxidase subunit 1